MEKYGHTSFINLRARKNKMHLVQQSMSFSCADVFLVPVSSLYGKLNSSSGRFQFGKKKERKKRKKNQNGFGLFQSGAVSYWLNLCFKLPRKPNHLFLQLWVKNVGGNHKASHPMCLLSLKCQRSPFLPLIGSEMEKPITAAYLHKEKQLSPNSAEEGASEKQQLCTELQSDACGDGTALGFKYLRSSVCVFIVTSVLAVLIAATDGPCLSRRVHRLWQSLPALPASPF